MLRIATTGVLPASMKGRRDNSTAKSMERFNIRCPDHYPMPCHLSPADKDSLLTKEKYKAFFIFQYKNQDEWLLPTIEQYFNDRTLRLFNAGQEGGTGTKFCNVCRYALASDFGIVSVTPLNFNVFQEMGLMQGTQKQLLYLLNPERKESELKKHGLDKLPFDIDDQIYVEHTDKETLLEGIDKKIPLIIEKVQLLTGFESGLRQHVKEKIEKLPDPAKEKLKVLLFEGPRTYAETEFDDFLKRISAHEYKNVFLTDQFIIRNQVSGGTRTIESYELNRMYRKYLEELLWR